MLHVSRVLRTGVATRTPADGNVDYGGHTQEGVYMPNSFAHERPAWSPQPAKCTRKCPGRHRALRGVPAVDDGYELIRSCGTASKTSRHLPEVVGLPSIICMTASCQFHGW